MRILIALIILGFSTQSYAAKLSQIGCFGNLYGQKQNARNFSEQPKVSVSEMKQVMDIVYDLYADEFFAKGWSLSMTVNESTDFNAFAQRQGDIANVVLFAGLGLKKASNTDVIALVACHELGHHIAGRPFYEGYTMSSEGQSDYFAGSQCMRRYIEATPFTVPLDIGTVKYCGRVWKDDIDIETCARTVGAAQAVTRVFAENNASIMTLPDITRRDSRRVEETFTSHPQAQCRLDTYASSALCQEPISEGIAAEDVWSGVCSEERGDRFGYRPRCWYTPLSIAIPR